MNLTANIRPRIIKDNVIHISRKINGQGELTAQVGMEVAPHDILGKASVSSGYSVINLAKRLDESPLGAQKLLQRPVGSTIFKGELLAEKKSLIFKKTIISPTDGVIDQYDLSSGDLRLKFLAKPVPLTSGVYGIVDQVDKEKGSVLIRTLATVIYGVYGSGEQRGGDLHIIGDQHSIIQASQITQQMYAQILVGGALVYADALKKAVFSGVQAVITGGLNITDFKSIVGSLDPKARLEEDVGFSVIATEGFGPLPFGDDVYPILKQFDGKFVFADGNSKRLILPSNTQNSLLIVRKTVLPFGNSLSNLPPEIILEELKKGQNVRVIWPPLMGQQGIVLAIDQSPTLLESGISTVMVTIETAHQKAKVPFPNLEIVI